MSKKHTVVKSFRHAIDGFLLVLRDEPNFRIHLIIALLAFALAAALDFNQTEWILLTLTVSLVVLTELVNTVIEKLTDIVLPEKSEEAKIVKDVSSAAVFVAASLALLVGLFLYLPKLPMPR